MEIAIFGGTFNPPTKAHQKITGFCAELSFIDEVWLLPSGQRLDKQFEIQDEHRVEMLNIMIGELAAKKLIRVVDIELSATGHTRTFETVKRLESSYQKDNFWFVYGVDSYNSMNNWHGGEELKDSLQMMLVPRSGHPMPQETERLFHLYVPEIVEMDLSSSKVREAAQSNEPFDNMVSRGIARYIEFNQLYKSA